MTIYEGDGVPGKVAAEDYRRQRQRADHGRDGFADEVRAKFDDFIQNGHDTILALAEGIALDEQQAEAVTDELFREVTTEAVSPIDEPFGHRIVRGIVGEIEAMCADGGIQIREGVVVGVSPTEGLHAYQGEVLETGASIIDFASPFFTFCNQFAILMARTLRYDRDGKDVTICCNPALAPEILEMDRGLFRAWGLLFIGYAIEGWPQDLPRLAVDRERSATRIQILHAMELFAVSHEYGHHVLRHGLVSSSEPDHDGENMEHDADSFARMVSTAIGTNGESPNPYEMSGTGGVLMLGALDLVRRTRHVLSAGNTDFPLRVTHPQLVERIAHIGTLDEFSPEKYREGFAGMRDDFLGIIEVIWAAIEPGLLDMHHKRGVKIPAGGNVGIDWISLI